jgi:hypothetical protein
MHNCTTETIRTASRLARFLCAVVLIAMSGCGHGGRMPVEGTVTLDGQPLEKGAIRLIPLSGTKGPTAGADIVDGKFVIVPAGGPFVGKFQVQISAVRFTGQKVLDPRSNAMIDEYAQYLPARYNSESKLQKEVTSSGPNQFEFALTSDKGPQSPK